jgi:CHAT domain-containing protein/Tfp pilus assembly protein PilF
MNLRLWVWGIAVTASILLGVPAVAVPSAMKISQGVSQQGGGNAAADAEKALKEGLQLYQQGTAESLRKAIAKFEEALKLYRATGDRNMEASTLSKIGRTYDHLGEKQKALEYHSQSLPLFRAVGDRSEEAVTLNNIGLVYFELGEKQKALEYYSQSLLLKRTIGGDRREEAITLSNIGRVYDDLGEKQKALEYYSQSLLLKRTIGDRSGEATTLNNIGSVYSDLGQKQKALEYYSQSLPLYRAIGDRLREARTLTKIGIIYSALGEKQKALEYYSQSLSVSRAIGDRRGETITLSYIARVYDDLGQKQKALEYYSQSLPLHREVGDRSGEATTLTSIGSVYDDLGEKQKALEYYNQSLPVYRAVGDRSEEADTLTRIGSAYDDLGEKQKALEYYNQSLLLYRSAGDRSEEANTLTRIGTFYSELGEKQKALEYYNQSLPLSRAAGDRNEEATTLTSIGSVYEYLGEKQKALEYYSQSLHLFRATGNRDGEAIILNNIGRFYFILGENQKSLEYYNQSLSVSRAINRSGEATTLNNIGRFYSELGEKQKALEYYNQSLPLSQAAGDRNEEAFTLYNIATVYSNFGENQKALEYYNQSLTLSHSTSNDGRTKARTLLGIAYVKRDRGNLTEALTNIEAALKIIENLRTKIASPELRTSYFATVQNYYQFYIDLLMQLHKTQPNSGYDTKAFEASERSRSRSLLELLQEANADIREGVSPELLQRERSLQQQLDAIEKRRVEVLSRPDRTPAQKTELDQKRQTLLTQYQEIQAQIRSTSPRYAALTQPEPLTLSQIQQQILDENTILIQYSLGKERSYLWAVTKNSITSYELPKRADIETATRNFRAAVTNPLHRNIPKKVAEANNKLSQIILQPIAAQLAQKRLLIVGDGILNYLPFSALSLPETSGKNPNPPLIVDHEIVMLPSASSLGILRQNYNDRQPPNRTLAILADPVFSADDERVKTPTTTNREAIESVNLGLSRSSRDNDVQWKRLKFTREEAEQIIKALDPTNSSTQSFDFEASRATATNPNLSQYKIIHFATHGLANSAHPELSGIVMSLVDEQGKPLNGFLRLTDIFNLKLAADLVVLSACQTGLGQNVQGEGIVGLTRGFMYAGAKRVVVSLWSVDDEGTATFMASFYQEMLQKGLTPAAALRAAQLEMLQQSKWNSPYYWAAFTLQGEWR